MFFASTTFVIIHTLISLVGIVTGLIVLRAMLRGVRLMPLTGLFLGFTLATSLTGFLFPFHGMTPAIAVGILSCLILAAAYAALYQFRLKSVWRPVYIVGAVMALWLNCFVLVVQSFLKIPFLHALAPNGNEPIFVIAQGLVLIAFVYAGYVAVQRFRPNGLLGSLADVTRKAA